MDKKGATEVHVAGFGWSPHYSRAKDVAELLQSEFPDQFQCVLHEMDHGDFFKWVKASGPTSAGDKPNALGDLAVNHATSPLVWMETNGDKQFVGGRDRLVEWVHANHAKSKADKKGQETLCTIL